MRDLCKMVLHLFVARVDKRQIGEGVLRRYLRRRGSYDSLEVSVDRAFRSQCALLERK